MPESDARAGYAGDAPVLAIEGLKTQFYGRDHLVKAVDDLSLALHRGETLGVVGESGCGKSVTALSVLRLVAGKPGIVAGRIVLEGRDLLAVSEREMRKIRGDRIGMIFQEPMSSLNPVLTIGRQLTETIRLHQSVSAAEARERAAEMLRLVQISEPARRLKEYPHQFSGGMRQRVMIAMALCCSPQVLIADEPTTALDVTVQAQILDLLNELQERLGTAVILITHDFGVVAETCRRVVVMYAGRNVEEAEVDELFAAPLHPYTRGLMESMPRLAPAHARAGDTEATRLTEIPGAVPSPAEMPAGCAFAPRCSLADDTCWQHYPDRREVRPRHWVACWRAEEVARGA